ncbi:MAG: hypothetical protein U0P81_07955 [Holophagaceae bacterium]
MADYALSDQFEVSGRWFLPDCPEAPLFGVLRQSPAGSELDLDGSFQKLRSIYAGDLYRYPVIHGQTSDGQTVTMLNAYQSVLKMKAGPAGLFVAEVLRAQKVLVGTTATPETCFSRCKFRIPGLQVWLASPVIERTFEKDESTGFNTFRYRLPVSNDLKSHVDSLAATIEWMTYCQDANMLDVFSGISVSVTGWLEIQPDDPKPLQWFLEHEAALTYFLSFLAGTPMSPDRIDVYLDTQDTPISVLFKMTNGRTCNFTSLHEFFISRDRLGIDLDPVLAKWFELFTAIQKPCELAFSIFASEGLYLHMEFLSWMQALEGLHRALPESVLPAIPTKGKRGPTLRQRLDSLSGYLSKSLRICLLGSDAVPPAWIKTRDYYTHWIESFRPSILDTEGLLDANVRACNLTTALLLVFSGVPQDAVLAAYQGASKTARELRFRNAMLARKQNPTSSAGLIMEVRESGTDSSAGN